MHHKTSLVLGNHGLEVLSCCVSIALKSPAYIADPLARHYCGDGSLLIAGSHIWCLSSSTRAFHAVAERILEVVTQLLMHCGMYVVEAGVSNEVTLASSDASPDVRC